MRLCNLSFVIASMSKINAMLSPIQVVIINLDRTSPRGQRVPGELKFR